MLSMVGVGVDGLVGVGVDGLVGVGVDGLVGVGVDGYGREAWVTGQARSISVAWGDNNLPAPLHHFGKTLL
jgi:hypothetical protein